MIAIESRVPIPAATINDLLAKFLDEDDALGIQEIEVTSLGQVDTYQES